MSAPAGYGKTIATIQWVTQSQRPSVWLNLDRYDNQISCFYHLFCQALLTFQPENHKMEQAIHHANFSLSPIAHTRKIMHMLQPFNGAVTLVLDDFHLITKPTLLNSFFHLQKSLPSNIHLIILTRNPVTLEEIEGLTEKKCRMMQAHQLAFTLDEMTELARKYFNAFSDLNLQNKYSLTEGWPMGVTAILQTLMMPEPPPQEMDISRYIKEQIWQDLTSELQDFMLKTSIVDELTPALCHLLTGVTESRQFLEQLVTQTPFLHQIDAKTYRYPHLFLTFLRQLNTERIETIALHGKATDYYVAHQQRFQAIRHALKSKNVQKISQSMSLNSDQQSSTLEDDLSFLQLLNFEDLTDDICAIYPFLYIYKLIYYYLIGDVFHLTSYFDQFAQALSLIKKSFPPYYLLSIFAFLLDPRASLQDLLEYYQTILAEYDKKTVPAILPLDSLTGQAPFLHRSLRNYTEFIDPEIVKRAEEIEQYAPKEMGNTLALSIQCGICLEQHDLKTASSLAKRLSKLLPLIEVPEIKYAVLLQIADVSFCVQNKKEVNRLLQQTEAYLDQVHAGNLFPNLVAYRTKIRLLEGYSEPADSWLNSGFVADLDHLYLHKTFQYFTTIRAFMVKEEYEKALNLVIRLRSLMADFHRPLDLAEAYVLQAIIERARGNPHFAQDFLLEALKITAKYGFIQIIATEAKAVLPILNGLQKRSATLGIEAAHFKKIMQATKEIAKKRDGMKIGKHRPVNLSKSQQHILSLLAKGYSYKQIMSETNLTIHTVKAHASTIYQKLQVPNATAAVAKAQKIGLLS